MIVQALLDAKADASLELPSTALDLAELYEHTDTAQVLRLHERQAAEAEAKAAVATAELLAEEAEEKGLRLRRLSRRARRRKPRPAPPAPTPPAPRLRVNQRAHACCGEEGRPEDVAVAAGRAPRRPWLRHCMRVAT